MGSETEIVVVGSHTPALFVRVHRVPLAGETVMGWGFQEPLDGGKGTNQAIAAARIGGHVAMVGCVGDDRLGRQAIELLIDEDVGVEWFRRRGSATGVGLIVLDDEGIPAIVSTLGANGEVSREHADEAIEGCRALKVVLTQFEIDPEVSLHAAATARARGAIAIVNPSPVPSASVAGLAAASVLVPNEIEAKAILGWPVGDPVAPQTLAAELRAASGVGSVVVTLGGQGAIVVEPHGITPVPVPKVQVLDTTGAGDVFCAALAVALAEGRTLVEAAAWGCAAASLSVSRPGSIPSFPTRVEVPPTWDIPLSAPR